MTVYTHTESKYQSQTEVFDFCEVGGHGPQKSCDGPLDRGTIHHIRNLYLRTGEMLIELPGQRALQNSTRICRIAFS